MLQEKTTFKEKQVDTEEIIKMIRKLPNREKDKIFYMIKGIELIMCVEEKKEVMLAAM